MPASGPYVKVSGLQRQARRLYTKVSGAYRLASDVYVKISGSWRRTALLLRSSLTIGTTTTSSGTSYGFDIRNPAFGAMADRTIGWNSVVEALNASKSTPDNRTRVVISLSSPANNMPFNTSSAVVSFTASNGASIACTVVSTQDLIPRTFWQVGDGAESLAVYNWLLERNGQTITVQGAFA